MVCTSGRRHGKCALRLCVFLTAHKFFQLLRELLSFHYRQFPLVVAPNLNGVIHADELDVLHDICHFQVAFRYQEPTIAIQRDHFNVRDKLAEDLPVGSIPTVESFLQRVQLLVPHGFRIKDKTRLVNVLSHHQCFLARCTQHLAENCRQESASFGISLGFYISYKSHAYSFIFLNSASKLQTFSPLYTTFHHKSVFFCRF